MNTYFSQNKWTYWLIGLLVLLNIFSIGALWMHKKGGGPERGPRQERGRMDNFMARELNLSDEQKAQFKTFWDEHKKEVNNSLDKIDALRKQRIETLLQSQPDSAQLKLLAQQIGQEHTHVEELLSEHYFKLNAICNEKQQQDLAQVFAKVIKRRGRRPEGNRKRGH